MEATDFTINEDSLRRAIASVDLTVSHRPTCDDFALLFGNSIEGLPEFGDAFRFLAVVCGWQLRPDREEGPFDALWHPFRPEHVTAGQLDAISDPNFDLEDVELRARLFDLLWVARRSHRHAKIAAESYVQSASRLIIQQQVIGVRERLLRAVQLSRQLGSSGGIYDTILEGISNLVEIDGLESCTLSDCLGVLADCSIQNAGRLYDISIGRARRLSQDITQVHWARRFWSLAAALAAKNGDSEGQRNSQLEVARSFETEAKAAPLQAVASHFLESALKVYRTIPNTDEERSRVHLSLTRAQREIANEIPQIDAGTYDISDIAAQARNRIKGLDIWLALSQMALATRWPLRARIQSEAEESIRRFPIQHLFSTVRFSSTWKVSAKAASSAIDASEIAADRLLFQMCQQYRCEIPFLTDGTIEPMRNELIHRHCILPEDISEFVGQSRLVPPDREALIVVGIHAGLHGRFIEALHVLVPQLEHMLRYAMQETVTSSITDSGIQSEFDLNKLLRLPETESLLGEDLCFLMRVLFTERHGYNLRNELSHGMKSGNSFFAPEAIYTWWLIFYLVAAPVAKIPPHLICKC